MLNWIGIAAINMAIAVALGAFGAHGLEGRVSTQQLEWWHTATLYLFVHALGLLLVGLLIRLKYITQTTAWLLQIGIIIFAFLFVDVYLLSPRGNFLSIDWYAVSMRWINQHDFFHTRRHTHQALHTIVMK